MYIPKHFEVRDFALLRPMMDAHPLATVMVAGASGIEVNSLPVFLRVSETGVVTLFGHMARANPLWRSLAAGVSVSVLFHGPSAYINSSWYAAPDVPTWNYASVLAVGIASLVEDFASLHALLVETTALQNSRYADQWQFFLPSEALVGAIVGFEIVAPSLVGKFKLNQNRSRADVEGAIAGLETRGDMTAAELMRRVLAGR